MRQSFRFRGALAAGLLAASLAGCQDELPTTVGEDFFPGGARPTTLVWELAGDEYAERLGAFAGYAGRTEALYLLAARDFDGALDANALVRLTGFPQAVSYTREGTTVTDSVFTYEEGRLIAPLDTLASAGADGPVVMRLWELAEGWDPGSVSWTMAVDTAGERREWQVPGGTPAGSALSEFVWTPGAEEGADSVSFPLGPEAVERIASPDFPGLLVTVGDAPARIQTGRYELRASARPESAPDTTVAVTVATGSQTFVFTPQPPLADGEWQAGGIHAARTLFRVRLPETLPGCPPGATDGCPETVPLGEVTLNEVALLLEPVPAPGGFRPLAPTALQVRTVGEPELGRAAPLGAVVAERQVAGELFATPDTMVAVSLTQYVAAQVARAPGEPTEASLALTGSAAGRPFGVAWFSPAPRLRIVYTLPFTLMVP